MGFNPITGGGGTSAHTHTNAASDGGALNTTTIMNSTPLYTQMLVLG